MAALARQTGTGRLSFHMPGHRGGQGWPDEVRAVLLDLDTTELPVTDDLHQATGPARLAMERAAAYFGAAHTLFLTNGATVGVLALLAGLVGRHQTVILPRTCHLSVYHALALLDIQPVWLDLPTQPERFGFLPAIPPQAVAQAIARAPHSRAVFLTSPDYYGTASDLARVADLAHQAGLLLLVDEAHGAHLAAAPDLLPEPALLAGADACVQSAHKTLPALTQGAFLQLSSGLMVRNPGALRQVRTALKVFMTSSPSFVIAASLDYARASLERTGHSQIVNLLDLISHLQASIGPRWLVSPATRELDQRVRRDPLRLVLTEQQPRQSALHWAAALSARGIDVEMADLKRLVLILALDTPAADLAKLAKTLQALETGFPPDDRPFDPGNGRSAHGQSALVTDLDSLEETFLKLLVQAPESVVNPGDILFGDLAREEIPLDRAAGRIAAVSIAPYPPGIPLVAPGERIDQARLDLLQRLLENKITLSGVDKNCLQVLA